MDIFNKKKLVTLDDFHQAEAALDDLWGTSDGRVEQLINLLAAYEEENETNVGQINGNDAEIPISDSDYDDFSIYGQDEDY